MFALVVLSAVTVGGVALSRRVGVHVPFVSDTCRVYASDQVVRMSPDQITHAATIAAAALRRGLPRRAATIGLATALQESKLRNLTSGDRDSVGLFQQRPSQGWGAPEQLNDPRYAAGMFYARLVKVPNWHTMRLTDAAQAVQLSGHPEAYQRWEGDAEALATAFYGAEPSAVTCELRARHARAGATVQPLLAELSADLGRLSVTPGTDSGSPVVAVRVSGAARSTVGWRTAHWLVAKSRDFGIERVSFAGSVWQADRGTWKRTNGTPRGDRVEARIATAG